MEQEIKTARNLPNRNVLIVDDDIGIVEVIEKNLKIRCFGIGEIYRAHDGNAAVDIYLEKKPEVIVLDAMLPRRHGFLVLEKIKTRKPANSWPYAIVITGNLGRRYEETARNFGAEEFLVKPFDMARLAQMVQTGLDKLDYS